MFYLRKKECWKKNECLDMKDNPLRLSLLFMESFSLASCFDACSFRSCFSLLALYSFLMGYEESCLDCEEICLIFISVLGLL